MAATPRYQRSPLADATNMVPIGVHLSSDEAVVFDPPDDQLIEDLREMIAAFRELFPTQNDTTAFMRVKANIKDLASQRDSMVEVLIAILMQMGAPDGGEPHELPKMLASAFDRFPQFMDFLELAAGCGDLAVDPEHPDNPLAKQTEFDHSTIVEAV